MELPTAPLLPPSARHLRQRRPHRLAQLCLEAVRQPIVDRRAFDRHTGRHVIQRAKVVGSVSSRSSQAASEGAHSGSLKLPVFVYAATLQAPQAWRGARSQQRSGRRRQRCNASCFKKTSAGVFRPKETGATAGRGVLHAVSVWHRRAEINAYLKIVFPKASSEFPPGEMWAFRNRRVERRAGARSPQR